MKNTVRQRCIFAIVAVLVIVASLTLVGCGGGGSAAGGNDALGDRSIVTAIRSSVSTTICPNGGISVDAGIDTNGNGVLDALEITSTQYVCNGANGLNTLVAVTTEPSGTNCASGGKKVSAGPDTNGDSMLDVAEITSSNYICNGATGTSGTNGTNGTNGFNTLVAILTESAGTNCASGGKKIRSGLDSNNNGVLDAGEVSSTNYVCNGATGPAGPGMNWVEVTGTSMQAVSNTGYAANNISQVTITLPSAPAMLDGIRVSGIGSGGWKVAQNSGQSIITKDIPGAIGALWTARESNQSWGAVASSSDGTKLVAVVQYGQIYTSTDSGKNWVARDSIRYWRSVASSSDGTKLAAVVENGQIYTSTDSGESWTAWETNRRWIPIASSADGTKLVAAEYGGLIYSSINSGETWTARDSNRNWVTVASSSDGTKLVAGVDNGQLYTSPDSGATWTAREASRLWFSVASSSDGTKLAAVAYGGQIYTSTDSGISWTARESISSWTSVASSADGTKLVALAYDGQIYTSTDSGVTWTAQASSRLWYAVASSSDGTKLAAAVYDGQLYTSEPRTTVGTAGSICGAQYDAIELQYIGNATFIILSHEGYLTVQ